MGSMSYGNAIIPVHLILSSTVLCHGEFVPSGFFASNFNDAIQPFRNFKCDHKQIEWLT